MKLKLKVPESGLYKTAIKFHKFKFVDDRINGIALHLENAASLNDMTCLLLGTFLGT